MGPCLCGQPAVVLILRAGSTDVTPHCNACAEAYWDWLYDED